MKFSTLFIISFLLCSCASVERSTLLGGLIGGSAGAMLGSASGNGSQGTLIVGTLGAGIGSLIGYSAFKSKQAKEQRNVKDNLQDSKSPSLTTPKVRRVWVPARIEGDKYMDGHYMYVIEKTSTWSE